MPSNRLTKAQIAEEFPPLADDDEFWNDAEIISQEFGSKFRIGNKPGDLTKFVGRFDGLKEVDDPDNESEKMLAANFTDSNGDRYYCWLFWSIRDVLGLLPGQDTDDIQLREGDFVRMEFKGEEETKRGLNKVKKVEVKVKRASTTHSR